MHFQLCRSTCKDISHPLEVGLTPSYHCQSTPKITYSSEQNDIDSSPDIRRLLSIHTRIPSDLSQQKL